MSDVKKIKGLYPKLLHIQKSVNGLGNDAKSFGYKYTSGTKVLHSIKPLMNNLGLLLKQEVLSIENTRQDYKTKNSEKSEILSKVDMRFTWIDAETGERDENLFGANGQNDWEKGLGSALTYAERYFLMKFFHINTDEDDIDNPDRKKSEVKTPTQSKPKESGVRRRVENISNLTKLLSKDDKRQAVLTQLKNEFDLTEGEVTKLKLTKEEAKVMSVIKG